MVAHESKTFFSLLHLWNKIKQDLSKCLKYWDRIEKLWLITSCMYVNIVHSYGINNQSSLAFYHGYCKDKRNATVIILRHDGLWELIHIFLNQSEEIRVFEVQNHANYM